MADVSDKVVGHLETMGPDDILHRAAQLERFDTVARRIFGLNDAPSSQGSLSSRHFGERLGHTSRCHLPDPGLNRAALLRDAAKPSP